MEQKIPITKNQYDILQELSGDERAAWQAKLDSFRINPENIMLKGSEDNVESVRNEIQKHMNEVFSSKEFAVKTPGALSCLRSDEINSLKLRRKVVIQVNGGQSPTYANTPTNLATFIHDGGIKIIVCQDNISKVSTDAIICPAEPDLKLHGEVGDYILEAGGLEIEEECTRYVARKGEVQPGQIYSSRAGNMLNCTHIFHAVGPQQNGSISDVMMNTLLKKCLEEAQKSEVSRMTIPLTFNYPADKLVEALWKVVEEFKQNQSDATLREIRMVDMSALRLYQCIRRLKAITKPHETSDSETVDGAKRPFLYNEADKTLRTEEGILVELFKGSICDVEPAVDVIVDSAPWSLDFGVSRVGSIANAIYQKGKETLQEEVKRTAPNGIKQPGDIVISEAPNIECCRHIYHALLVSWDGKRDGNSVKILCDTAKAVLTTMQKENHSSVAIPALGSGVLKIPMDIVVDALFEELNAFSKDKPRTCVKRVVFVPYDKNPEAVKKFTAKLEQLVKSAKKYFPKWTYTFPPHDYELLLSLRTLTADSLDDTQQELTTLLTDSVTSEIIHRSSQPCLDEIDDDKAKALQWLQYTHRVRVTLHKSSDRLDSILIEGFVDDVTKAKQDVLDILAQ